MLKICGVLVYVGTSCCARAPGANTSTNTSEQIVSTSKVQMREGCLKVRVWCPSALAHKAPFPLRIHVIRSALSITEITEYKYFSLIETTDQLN